MNLEKLKYPIGKNAYDANTATMMKTTWINTIKSLPSKIESVVNDLSSSDFELLYRPDGWSIAQVIHHLADSHMVAYTRTKHALTGDYPKVLGYVESDWAKLPDSTSIDVTTSLNILNGLHPRWAQTFETIKAADFEKKYLHLGYNRDYDLMHVLSLYAWHSEHHLAHVHQALKHKGDFK